MWSSNNSCRVSFKLGFGLFVNLPCLFLPVLPKKKIKKKIHCPTNTGTDEPAPNLVRSVSAQREQTISATLGWMIWGVTLIATGPKPDLTWNVLLREVLKGGQLILLWKLMEFSHKYSKDSKVIYFLVYFLK